MKISYAITVADEEKEIISLITQLTEYIRREDEIVVLLDKRKSTPNILNYLHALRDNNTIILHEDTFKNNFAEWKNNLNNLCSGDYIFQIDADEIPNEWLLNYLPFILENNNEIDLYLIPRINVVVGLEEEDIAKWGWDVNEMGWVNFPDSQTRIYKNNPTIKWSGKVHERIVGYNKYSYLPLTEDYTLLHVKTIEKQRKQNEFYDGI
jgi:hypothetical protein